jgi:hypothetical protein
LRTSRAAARESPCGSPAESRSQNEKSERSERAELAIAKRFFRHERENSLSKSSRTCPFARIRRLGILWKIDEDDEVRVFNTAGISGFRRGTRRFGFRDASSTTSTCYSSGYRSACTAGARFPARSGSGSASAAGSEFAAWRARGSWKCVRRKREWRRVEFPWEGCSLFGSWHEHRYLGRKELEH